MLTEADPIAMADSIGLRACVGSDHQPYVMVFAVFSDGSERAIATLTAEGAAQLGLVAVEQARVATNNATFAEWLRAKLGWEDTAVVQAIVEVQAIALGYGASQIDSITAADLTIAGDARTGWLDRASRWALRRAMATQQRRSH